MKTMKKLFALLLALTMVFGLAATAFAANDASGKDTTGTIQITNPAYETTYSAYRLLDLESFAREDGQNGEVDTSRNGNYSYKLNPEWCEFFGYNYDEDTMKYTKNDDSTEAGANIITIDDAGVGYVTAETFDSQDMAAFAKAAMAWGSSNNKTVVASLTTKKAVEYNDDEKKTDGTLKEKYLTTDEDGTLTAVPLGYYLVDTTQGALCSLGTTDKNAEIEEKTGEPTVDKKVTNENNQPDVSNDVNIGDIVTYTATVNAQDGADNYILHDTMDEGLTFQSITSVTVDYADKYTTKTDVTLTKDAVANGYILTAPAVHKDANDVVIATHTFDMSFTADVLASLQEGDKIVVVYTAKLNDKAVIAGANKNEIKLEYGDGNFTEPSETRTYTWQFNVLKYHDNNVGLAGAKFKLGTTYDADKNEVGGFLNVDKYTRAADDAAGYDADMDYYKLCVNTAHNAETTNHYTEITTNAKGKFNIDGLDAGIYYLYETEAPVGFNKLSHPIQVIIAEGTTEGTFVVTFKNYVKDASGKWAWEETANPTTGYQVPVENLSGTELPSTGGMGTTLFYVFGSILMIGATVLLVAKKRTNI